MQVTRDGEDKIEAPKKWKVGWGYTAACNMRCPFCYSHTVRQNSPEVDLQTACRFIDSNAAFIDSINYGTGESPLSSSWFDLIAFVRNHYPAIRQSVTTNGSLAAVTRNDQQKRRTWLTCIDEVDISLDFADADRHNQTRGCQTAYQWVLETLQTCAQEGIVATIVFVGFADTLEVANMEGLFALAARHNAFVRINVLRPTAGVRIPPPTYETLMSALLWIMNNHFVVSLCDPLIGALFDSTHVHLEATGTTSMRILPDGTITPSTYLITNDWRGTNIRDNPSLSELQGEKAFQRIRQGRPPQDCLECHVVHTCRGGAIDRRILHFNTLEKRDPYCPAANNSPFPGPVALKHFSLGGAPTVHDGYLPTLIFAPATMLPSNGPG